MDYSELTRELRTLTEPSSERVARVRTRLDRALVPATAELSRLPAVPPAAVARVKARLAEPRRRPLPLWVGAGVAFAAASVVLAGWWSARENAAAPIDLALSTAGVEHLASGATLTHDGEGRAVVQRDRLTVDWDYGQVAVDAPPSLTVTVTTPEGSVQAEGGAFLVDRGPLGTRIASSRGSVTARCGSGEPTALVGTVSCDPLTATGWLTRARAREADRDQVLADLDRGLALPDAVGAVRSELLTLRTTTLVAAGRPDEALASAEAALLVTDDPGRIEDLQRTAARLALTSGDCARALPHLRALRGPDAEEAAYLARCSGR